MRLTFFAVAAAVALVGCLTACETATPYQPVNPANASAGGYSDTRLDADHYRVMFQGNTLTSRETVERYLLYRAAELTTSQGFDWFVTADQQTDEKNETFADPVYGYGWAPSWRFRGRRGWGAYGVWGGAAWGYGFGGPWGSAYGPETFQEYSSYQVSVEIVMGHGNHPADGHALNAREVLNNLGSQIQRPSA